MNDPCGNANQINNSRKLAGNDGLISTSRALALGAGFSP
jgi:hypothetical protein